MIDNRRTVGWLDAELARREDAETRMTASLLDLERHPGHLALADGSSTGLTGQRWLSAQQALAALWRDFAAYRGTVRAARMVRDSRPRPGERELAELHRLLVEPSVEVARTAVALPERGLTGAPERVETVALDELGTRMERAFTEVSGLVVAMETAQDGYLAAVVPVAEKLRAARRRIAVLGIRPAEKEAVTVAALTDRAAALDRAAAADPLGFAAGGPAAATLAALVAEVDAVSATLTGYSDLDDRWDGDLATARGTANELTARRALAERDRARAVELIAGPVPELPAGDPATVAAALAAAEQATGWDRRTAALTALRAALDGAEDRLRTAHELVTGLLERRDELRGRFGAFRARAARLGRAEDAAVLELDAEIERLLWTKPCDLAAATRALAGYRHHLAGQAPGRSA